VDRQRPSMTDAVTASSRSRAVTATRSPPPGRRACAARGPATHGAVGADPSHAGEHRPLTVVNSARTWTRSVRGHPQAVADSNSGGNGVATMLLIPAKPQPHGQESTNQGQRLDLVRHVRRTSIGLREGASRRRGSMPRSSCPGSCSYGRPTPTALRSPPGRMSGQPRPRSVRSDGRWGAAVGLLLIGLPMWIWGEPISRWNRRVGRKGRWQVPPEDEAESTCGVRGTCAPSVPSSPPSAECCWSLL
jgi:hypothetical protein